MGRQQRCGVHSYKSWPMQTNATGDRVRLASCHHWLRQRCRLRSCITAIRSKAAVSTALDPSAALCCYICDYSSRYCLAAALQIPLPYV